METITRDELKRETRGESRATVIEVLGRDDYASFHLPGAINVPFNADFDEKIQAAVPDKNEKIIVYCRDRECPTSSQAAQRMDQLGYRNVCDYRDGKHDWKRAGLPIDN